jgi:hypothetical protein
MLTAVSAVAGAWLAPAPVQAQALITATSVHTLASAATAGVGLRNRGSGVINLSGVVAPVKAAFVYWAVDTVGVPPAAAAKISVTRELPTGGAAGPVALTGTAVLPPTGGAAGMCWFRNAAGPLDRLTVFKATLPAGLVNGSGLYRVTLAPGGSGLTDGEDPWASPLKSPLAEGASLVVIGTGTGRVAIYDNRLAARSLTGANPAGAPTYTGETSYALSLPVKVTYGVNRLIWHTIAADGQSGGATGTPDDGLVDQVELSLKDVIMFGINAANASNNPVPVSGPGAVIDMDPDFSGAAARPLPQLWDDNAHDVTSAVLPSSGNTAVKIGVEIIAAPSPNAPSGAHPTTHIDCVGGVANVVEIQ